MKAKMKYETQNFCAVLQLFLVYHTSFCSKKTDKHRFSSFLELSQLKHLVSLGASSNAFLTLGFVNAP